MPGRVELPEYVEEMIGATGTDIRIGGDMASYAPVLISTSFRHWLQIESRWTGIGRSFTNWATGVQSYGCDTTLQDRPDFTFDQFGHLIGFPAAGDEKCKRFVFAHALARKKSIDLNCAGARQAEANE